MGQHDREGVRSDYGREVKVHRRKARVSFGEDPGVACEVGEKHFAVNSGACVARAVPLGALDDPGALFPPQSGLPLPE